VREWLGRKATWRLAVQDVASALAGVAVGAVIIWIVTGDWYWDWCSSLFFIFLAFFTVRRSLRRAGESDEGSMG
jgi:membrane protein implicated in regulation of membrane protease activity